MDIYSRKYIWKLVLLFFALAIIVASLIISNVIVDQVREDEKLRIRIWSEAVKNTVNQMYVTGKLFDRLRDEERKKVKLWAKATQELGKDLSDYTFAIEVVQQNKTVPVILTDNKGNYSSSLNLDFTQEEIEEGLKKSNPDQQKIFYQQEAKRIFEDTISKLVVDWQKKNPPIVIYYKEKPVNYVYYRESNILDSLERKKDSLMYSFRQELVKNQALVPVIFTDSSRSVVIETNFDEKDITGPGKLQSLIDEMAQENEPIEVQINEKEKGFIFYRESEVLKQLRYFPYIQLIIVGVFILVGYIIFSTFRRAEQNRVWAGMAKETAHQLGTPISSLMAWLEILRAHGTDESTIKEMNKDIDRLQTVTERFSKIGSEEQLEEDNLCQILEKTTGYLKTRLPKKTELSLDRPLTPVWVMLNAPLFEWVIENLVKNAVDAMEGEGKIVIELHKKGQQVFIDVSDTGKGISSNKFKSVFEPGYSTKKRGWGLGLTLAKRIIEQYHKGQIAVLRSDPGKGTTFRITLKSEN
ncbi:MAG: ATP-binding protein [Bacteroidota bacterium]